MGSTFFPIFMLMLAIAGISILFGYSLGSTSIPRDELEQIKEKAFNEAKEKYIKYFHKTFDPQANTVQNSLINQLSNENKKLVKENSKLKKELKEERKKNGEAN